MVTGSASGAYSTDPWIIKLTQKLQDIFNNFINVKLVGICFGHQIIAHALTDLKVIVNPKGWELGVYTVDLTKTTMTPLSERGSYRIQMLHHDIVIGDVVGDWKILGCTDICPNQGLYLKNRVLTLQGHFEFDKIICQETVDMIDPVLTPKEKQKTLERIKASDDSDWVIDKVIDFFITC